MNSNIAESLMAQDGVVDEEDVSDAMLEEVASIYEKDGMEGLLAWVGETFKAGIATHAFNQIDTVVGFLEPDFDSINVFRVKIFNLSESSKSQEWVKTELPIMFDEIAEYTAMFLLREASEHAAKLVGALGGEFRISTDFDDGGETEQLRNVSRRVH